MNKNPYQEAVNNIAKNLIDIPAKHAYSAIHGKQGKHSVYTIMMPLHVLAELFDADVGNAFARSQRPVNQKRAKVVTNYIRENNNNYVIPSLTATIQDFKPCSTLKNAVMYNDADFETAHQTLNLDAQTHGESVVLHVPETSRWWFIDGQHRATGIQGLKSALAAMGMEILDMFPNATVAVMVRLDTGLEDRQNQFSIINSNMVKPNSNLNALYSKKERTGTIIHSTINKHFNISDLEFDKTSCSGKNPHRFAYKHLVDASLVMLDCKINDDIGEDDIKRLDEMWALYVQLSFWNEFKIKRSQELREKMIAPHAVFISAFALTMKKLRSDNVSFSAMYKVFNQKIDYSRTADCWSGLCIFDGKLVKNSKTVAATADYIYSVISNHSAYKRQIAKNEPEKTAA